MTRLAILSVALLALAGAAQAQAVPPPKSAVAQTLTPGVRDVSNPVGTGAAATGAGLGVVELGLEADRKLIKAQGSYAGQVLNGGVTTGAYNAALKSNSALIRGAKVAGGVASAVELTADVVSAATSCSNGDVGNCTLDSLDVAADVVGLAPGAGQALSASYTAGKLVGQGINAGYEYISGQSLGADLYDVTHKDEDAKIWADVERQKGAMQARAAAAYQQSAGALQQKQDAYDAEQAQIARQQAEAAQQQAMAQQQAVQNQQFVNSLMGSLAPPPPAAAAPAAPMASPTGCHPGHDEAAHPGGCHQGSGTAR